MNYVQCKLQRGLVRQTSWIPDKFAKVGKYLELKEDGEWENGWEVISTYGTKPEKQVIRDRDKWRSQRKYSDI